MFDDTGDVFETSEDGRYRVRIVHDMYPHKPEDDGATPILQIDRGHVEDVSIGSYELPGEILSAARYWSGEPEKFERYLRIFHGTTDVKWGSRSYAYVTFDTAEWRQKMGLTDEWIAAHSEHFDKCGIANMDEWLAWCEGDVYGIVVERLEAHVTDDERASARETLGPNATYDDVLALADQRAEVAAGEGVGIWNVVESVWGFYGESDYLKEEARNMLTYAKGGLIAQGP